MSTEQNQRLKAIGERIKELRIQAGYTSHEDFANAYNIQPKQIWRLESGKYDLKVSTLLRLLDIHKITLGDFFKDF